MICEVPYYTIGSEAPRYPTLLSRLGLEAPPTIGARGNLELLDLPLTALFSSVRVPPEAALSAFDLMRCMVDPAHPVIGGFQSPLERECLDILLQAKGAVVLSPARNIEDMRSFGRWSRSIAEGRLLLVSPFTSGRRRPSQDMARARNRFVTALASRMVIVHAMPGGRVQSQLAEALRWGIPVSCFDIPENRDLLVMGARPLPVSKVGRPQKDPASTQE